jgi:oligopeptide/dipeptide ABC transporter ATP-binding protein
MPENLLEFREVTKVFRRAGSGLVRPKTVRAVDRVSLAISTEPQVIALVGESGSGKTTMSRMVLGLETPTSGQVVYKGTDVAEWLRRKPLQYRREVQIIFQDPYGTYNPFYRVDRVLASAARRFRLAPTRAEMKALGQESLTAVGLRPAELLGRYPHQLSGGERQRFMLARIYMIRPKLIVADEPVSMLDASLRAMFLDHLKSFKNARMSCLYVTHDLNIAYFIADRIVILSSGTVVEEGITESIVKDPLHPYTRELIDSIPEPDPSNRWRERLDAERISRHELREAETLVGCIYRDRCRHAMPRCELETPLLARARGREREDREVACFLYA